MRKEIVPVDLVSEQKTIMGYVSVRQLIYVSVGGGLAYQIVQFVPLHFLPITMQFIVYTLLLTPIAGIVFWLGFWFRDEYDMYWDRYLMLSVIYHRTHKENVFRHGDDAPEWRTNDGGRG